MDYSYPKSINKICYKWFCRWLKDTHGHPSKTNDSPWSQLGKGTELTAVKTMSSTSYSPVQITQSKMPINGGHGERQ